MITTITKVVLKNGTVFKRGKHFDVLKYEGKGVELEKEGKQKYKIMDGSVDYFVLNEVNV